MKKVIYIVFWFLLLIVVYIYRDVYISLIYDNFFKVVEEKRYSILYNQFSEKQDYEYVQMTDNFYAQDKDHLKNIVYTFLDSGMYNFSFECTYDNCLNDFSLIISDGTLDYISSFVHPFNVYDSLDIKTLGKDVSISVDHKYTNDKIYAVQAKLTEIEKKIIKEKNSVSDNITVFHNYIVGKTKYDKEAANLIINDLKPTNDADNAYGLLFDNKAVCTGYTDTISIYLWRHGIPNYRITSPNHTWNYVNINNKWYHIDATWDDPTNVDVVDDRYLLITTAKLNKLEHSKYNADVYSETKKTTK